MLTTHLKCAKCGGEFDFEEIPHLRPGSAYSTVTYDGHKLATRAFGFFGVATSIVHIAVNVLSSTLNPIQAYSLTSGNALAVLIHVGGFLKMIQSEACAKNF